MVRLRIGTRGSQLAQWQANHVAGRLRASGHEVTLAIIKTTGDRLAEAALSQAGSKGMFIKEIEEALAAGAIDLAVHSLKDLPTEMAPQFELAAVLAREDARDALVSQKHAALGELGRGARVGTSSLRRAAQLKALRPDLEILPLRGNVDTRLRKLAAGEFDAMVLALAGLARLGKAAAARQVFRVEEMCPAAGQGALGIEIRRGDEAARRAVTWLEHRPTRAATDCERALLAGLGGGCQVPIGAYAEWHEAGLRLLARVGAPDGSKMLSEGGEGNEPAQLGGEVAARLLARGAGEMLQQIPAERAAVLPQP